MTLRMTVWGAVLALGCSPAPKDTDSTTTGDATSTGTTDGPTTTGDEPVTTGQVSTGPGGGDTTSSSGSDTGDAPSSECTLYCDEFMPNCSAIPDVEVYDDLDDCLTTCATFAHGPVGEFMGDTVECRVAHLTFDPAKPPGYYELHCFHAQEHPTANCV